MIEEFQLWLAACPVLHGVVAGLVFAFVVWSHLWLLDCALGRRHRWSRK